MSGGSGLHAADALFDGWERAWSGRDPEAFAPLCHAEVPYEDPLLAEPLEGVRETLAQERHVRAVGRVEDRDRAGHAGTVNPPPQGKVKPLGWGRWQ